MSARGSLRALLVVALLFASPAHAADAPARDAEKSLPPAPSAVRGPLVVFAASSLHEGMTALGHRFTAATGLDVRFNFAGSQELRTQLEQGAQADLFVSADRRHAEALEQAGLVLAPTLFARNRLTIVVRRGNPEGVQTLADLAGLAHLAIGAHEVPVGAYAEQLLALADKRRPGLAAHITAKISSRELNVRQVLMKVALGEADAGIVYATDARAMATRVAEVPLPPELALRTDDLIAIASHAQNPPGASAFIAFVLSAAGQAELSALGFSGPELP